MFIYFSANKRNSKNQSGFQPGDSYINQLLSVTNKIFTSSDNGLEVRSISLDISKAFFPIRAYFPIEKKTAFLVN